jgi:hypothetical protein
MTSFSCSGRCPQQASTTEDNVTNAPPVADDITDGVDTDTVAMDAVAMDMDNAAATDLLPPPPLPGWILRNLDLSRIITTTFTTIGCYLGWQPPPAAAKG